MWRNKKSRLRLSRVPFASLTKKLLQRALTSSLLLNQKQNQLCKPRSLMLTSLPLPPKGTKAGTQRRKMTSRTSRSRGSRPSTSPWLRMSCLLRRKPLLGQQLGSSEEKQLSRRSISLLPLRNLLIHLLTRNLRSKQSPTDPRRSAPVSTSSMLLLLPPPPLPQPQPQLLQHLLSSRALSAQWMRSGRLSAMPWRNSARRRTRGGRRKGAWETGASQDR
mmetsp:Transcript_5686/g.20008  ORF Transcript_5686/g.20008 Transcript_5686/m.20008 type:complete len:219 (+) Transcript_5686:2048-2704(+)